MILFKKIIKNWYDEISTQDLITLAEYILHYEQHPFLDEEEDLPLINDELIRGKNILNGLLKNHSLGDIKIKTQYQLLLRLKKYI